MIKPGYKIFYVYIITTKQSKHISKTGRMKIKGGDKDIRGSWFTLLYSRNTHTIVKQLYSNKDVKRILAGRERLSDFF